MVFGIMFRDKKCFNLTVHSTSTNGTPLVRRMTCVAQLLKDCRTSVTNGPSTTSSVGCVAAGAKV